MNWRGRPLTSHAVVLESIAATTTRTGLTVAAALDEGRYPTKTKVSDQQMKHLRERAMTGHAFHGTWNYTLHPPRQGPAPPPGPPAPPSPLAAVIDALNCPALTGMTRQDLAALAAALHTPFQAAREQHLYTVRGGPRRALGWAARPYRGKLDLTAHLVVTLLHQRLSLPRYQIAAQLGLDHTVVCDAVRLTRTLLAARGTTIDPAPARIRALADLRRYAHAAGTDLPAKIKPAS